MTGPITYMRIDPPTPTTAAERGGDDDDDTRAMTRATRTAAPPLALAVLGVVARPPPASGRHRFIDLCAATGRRPRCPAARWSRSGATCGATARGPTAAPAVPCSRSTRVTRHRQPAQHVGVDTALLFQGQAIAPDLTGVANGGQDDLHVHGLAGPAPTSTRPAPLPGAQHQTAMGLHGALVVHPTTAGQAYADAGRRTTTRPSLVLSEIDPALNTSANPAISTCASSRRATPCSTGTRATRTRRSDRRRRRDSNVLLRYVNAGIEYHSMGVLGGGQTVIALDGSPLTTRATTSPRRSAQARRLTPWS